MSDNYFLRAFFIIVLAAMFLLAYPLVHSSVPFLQDNFKTYTFSRFLMYNSLKRDSSTVADSVRLDDSTVVSVALDSNIKVEEVYDYDLKAIKMSDYTGIEQLSAFYEKLSNAEEQIRIAYFGDSSIEGDLISATVRDSLQRRFGGNGVGFVPITSKTNGFRRTVRHRFSNNWYHCYIGKSNAMGKRRGISGEYFLSYAQVTVDTIQVDSTGRDSIIVNTPDRSYWVSYRPVNMNPGVSKISSARLFYGTPNYNDTTEYNKIAGKVTIKTEKRQIDKTLSYKAMVNELVLIDSACQKLILNFQTPSSLPLYGVSLESKTGVVVDNFSSRGNLGPGLKYISSAVLQDFQYYMNYDLIILQFGLNVTNPKIRDYSWYERDMSSVIQHFKKSFPGVSILLVGPPDKAMKLGGRMRTDPSVPLVNQALQRVAEKNEVAFFSMYLAMGGEGSMVEWVRKKRPKLANYDYTHFNFRGAEVAGKLVLDFLLAGYNVN